MDYTFRQMFLRQFSFAITLTLCKIITNQDRQSKGSHIVGVALPRIGNRVTYQTDLDSVKPATDRVARLALASWGEHIIVEPDQILSIQNPEMFLGVVVSGQLEKRVTDGTRILMIDTLGTGATFLLPSTASCYEAPLPVRAVRRSVVSVLDRDGLVQAFARLPALSMSVFAEAVQRLARTEDRLEEKALTPGRTQLARLILRLTLARGTTCARGIPQHKLANWLGIHRESLTMLLGQMKAEGLVRVKRLHIEVLDETALRQAADAGTGKWLNSVPELDPTLLPDKMNDSPSRSMRIARSR
jgi:CRP-like cAMP-binding protein